MKRLIAAICVLAAGAAAPADPAAGPGANLARGKPCRLEPRPNYRHCTDPGDAAQLTDGVYAKGYFWTQKQTVGWSRANPATVTIDLGRTEPIRGVTFNTAAGTAPFRKAVAAWITWWVGRLKQWDIAPGQLGLLLVDEPHDMAESQRIIEYARVIQAAQPDVVVWEDVTWREPWKAPAELFAVCDILCANLPMWIGKGKPFADFYVRQREAGRTLWFYSCSGPGKLLDPCAYHRMQHWFCWRYGARGSCFWAFGDSNGASSWNEYLSGRGAYTPLFLDEDSVTAGVHMEAIREGMEDYEYLRMLRDRVATLQAAGKTGAPIDAARQLLATAADRVTGPMTDPAHINWREPKDRAVADTVRVEVLDMLTKLRER